MCLNIRCDRWKVFGVGTKHPYIYQELEEIGSIIEEL